VTAAPVTGFLAASAATGALWLPRMGVTAPPPAWLEYGATATLVGCLLYAVTTLWKAKTRLEDDVRHSLNDRLREVAEANKELAEALKEAHRKPGSGLKPGGQ